MPLVHKGRLTAAFFGMLLSCRVQSRHLDIDWIYNSLAARSLHCAFGSSRDDKKEYGYSPPWARLRQRHLAGELLFSQIFYTSAYVKRVRALRTSMLIIIGKVVL